MLPHIIIINSCELKTIELESTNLTDSDVSLILKNCPRLENLNLSNCTKITGNFIENLSPGITKIAFGKTVLSQKAIESLNQSGFKQRYANKWKRPKNFIIKSEEILNLERKDYIDAKIKSATQFRSIKLSNVSNLTDMDIFKIFYRRPDLKKLEIAHCKLISGAQAIKGQYLSELTLNDVDLNDEDIETILNNNPNLKSLTLDNCENISDCVEKLIVGRSISFSSGSLRVKKEPLLNLDN